MKAWEKKINHLAETLPPLYKKRKITERKLGKWLIDNLSKEQLKDFLKQIPGGEIKYESLYRYQVEVSTPVDHRAKLREIWRQTENEKFLLQYAEMVREIHAKGHLPKLSKWQKFIKVAAKIVELGSLILPTLTAKIQPTKAPVLVRKETGGKTTPGNTSHTKEA